MYHRNQLYTSAIYRKFYKVYRRLQQLLQTGSYASSEKIKSLTKRCDHCLKQLRSVNLYPIKTGSALAVTILLSAKITAQQCSQYADANAANPLAKVTTKYNSSPVFVDIDNDGDLDCYVAGKDGYLAFFKNVGTKDIPVYIPDGANGFSSSVHIGQSVQFADLDGDGDYDCFVTDGFFPWHVEFFENTGTKTEPSFVENEAKNPLSFIKGSYGLFLTIADIDSDGDYDVFTSDAYYGRLYQNTGTKTVPQFSRISSKLLGGDNRIYYDWNKDGLVDYIDYSGDSYHRNIGPTPADLKYVLDPNGPNFSVLGLQSLCSLADINGDGTPEAFSYTCDLATVTPVPVIRDSAVSSSTKLLSASPKNNSYKYHWQRNGKDIPNAINNVLFTSTPGLYTVEITNTCGTGVSSPHVLNTQVSTFADEDASNLQFTKAINTIQPSLKAYPNPFTQEFTLNLGDNYSANTTIKISDVQGRIISSIKANGNVMQLGGNLPKGIYIVQVIQNNTIMLTQKMIKE